MTEQEERAHRQLGASFERNVVAMQAAYIEWKSGDGADAAMGWIANTLDGPDLIPDLAADKRTAQEYFDQEAPPL